MHKEESHKIKNTQTDRKCIKLKIDRQADP